jgi:NAD-dependent SIR2 family protein deacetylase
MQCPGQVQEVDTMLRTTSLVDHVLTGAGTTTDLHIPTGTFAGCRSKKLYSYQNDICNVYAVFNLSFYNEYLQ